MSLARQNADEALEAACFVAGTLVLTPTGYRAIETLQVGELVLASDPETGVVKACRILQAFERDVAVVLEIQVGEEHITCTPEHPFWVPEQGWVQAGKLQVGMPLLTREGQTVQVQAIELRNRAVSVYNFEVEGFHTYFVSTLRILVHNTCPSAYDDSLGFITVPKPDPAADALANKIGGQPRVRFASDPRFREFDAVSDDFIAQAKPALQVVNKSFRDQAKATFEAAQQTNRGVYYEFSGQPAQEVIDKLNEYAERYQVSLTIDIIQ